MSSFTFNQCEVVGRSLPTPSYQQPKIRHMNVYPTNEVTEKSKYRCFLRKPNKLKKGSNVHVLVIDKASLIIGGCVRRPIRCLEYNASSSNKSAKPVAIAEGPSMSFRSLVQPLWKIQSSTSQSWLLLCGYGTAKFGECAARLHKVINWKEKFKISFPVLFIRLAVGTMLLVSLSVAVSKTSSWALTEENLVFLEAWRTVDRAYYDKTFNGQSWFRYRENALRNEPMNTREETYTAIKKMLATLDDPFTRFLEPEKFKSLRSGTQGSLTGVGLSIGYPIGVNGSSAGLVVISSSPEGPANRAGIMPGNAILSIDDTSTEMMGLYDAAERLQSLQPQDALLQGHSLSRKGALKEPWWNWSFIVDLI